MSQLIEITLDTWIGEQSLIIRPKQVYLNKAQPFAVCEVDIITRFHDRAKYFTSGLGPFEKLDDFVIRLPQALLSVEALRAFNNDLREWVTLPLKELGITYFHEKYELGYEQSNSLFLDFGLYPETPSKTDWIRLLIKYRISIFSGEFKFHVDYTCLNNMYQELNAWLDGV